MNALDFPYYFIEQTDSTNRLAIDMLSKTNPEQGFLVITDYQTAGKGQFGRSWQSEAGQNILASFIFYPILVPVDCIFRLHILSSLSIIKLLITNNVENAQIKWPNDIYVGSKKVGGILIQNSLKGSIIQWSVMGIGLNVNQVIFPSDLQASSMKLETGHEFNRYELIAQLRQELLDQFNQLDNMDWNEKLEMYNQYLYLRGINSSFQNEKGVPFNGRIQDVTERGCLRVVDEKNQLLSFNFGELKYLS